MWKKINGKDKNKNVELVGLMYCDDGLKKKKSDFIREIWNCL